jgi:hypothetical protein
MLICYAWGLLNHRLGILKEHSITEVE